MSATVAVVGRGFGRAVHAPGWVLAGARTVRVAGRDDWRELVAHADVVSIATPPTAHAEIALEAVHRGARILCEKPLAATLADAELIESAARVLPTAVNFAYRAIPAFVRFRELLDPNELDVRWTTGSRLRPAPPSWKDDPTQGGALSGYGVHALDYLRWMLGDLRVETATISPDESSFTALLEHDHGSAKLTVSLVAEERVHRIEAGDLVLENTHSTDPVRTFTLRRRGRGVDIPRPRLEARPDADPRVEPFLAHARALLDDGERPTFTDGLQAQRLLDEIRRAAS